MAVKTFKSDEARVKLRDILDSVDAGDQVVIERYNKPIGVIIPYEEWKTLQISQALQEAAQVRIRLQNGKSKLTSIEELKALMLAKRTEKMTGHGAD